MTVYDLLSNVELGDFKYFFENESDCYNALCDSSRLLDNKITKLMNIKDLDWDEAFAKLGFYVNETIIGEFMSKFPDYNESIFLKALKLVEITIDETWGGIELIVEKA